MNILLMFFLYSGSLLASEQSFHERLIAVEDISNELEIGMNSFPGINEELISDYVFDHHFSEPIVVSIRYGKIIGKTRAGKSISEATVYFVNPKKTIGILWWRRVVYHIVKEPDWTLFKVEKRTLNKRDEDAIKSLFNWN